MTRQEAIYLAIRRHLTRALDEHAAICAKFYLDPTSEDLAEEERYLRDLQRVLEERYKKGHSPKTIEAAMAFLHLEVCEDDFEDIGQLILEVGHFSGIQENFS